MPSGRAVSLAVAITTCVVVAGDAGARYESGGIDNAEAAIAAVKPWLPREADQWRVTRVVLVKEAGDLAAVTPDLPGSGLTRDGFPGPVWAVVASARCNWAPRSQRLEYILDASTGADLVRSGGPSCHVLQPVAAFARIAVEADEHEELERRLLASGLAVCNGGCRQYRRTHAACKRTQAELNRRSLYRCRVQSEEVGGGNHAVPVETICVALGRIGDRGYDARPLAECR